MFRFVVAAFFFLLGWSPGWAELEATCLEPALQVTVDQVTLSAGTESPTLHLSDPNPPEQVSGYDIYRSPVASAPSSSWMLLAFDAMDEDAVTPGVQWTDNSGDVSATGLHFYLAAAYNGPCDTEGPWRSPTLEDADEDGVPDGDDPCPATLAGASHLTAGCSASDLLIWPEVLVDPIGAGIEDFLAGLGAAVPPDPLLPSLAEAELSLAAVYDEMQGVMPCTAATSFAASVGFLNDALVAIEEHLATLPTAPENTGGSDEWPSPEFRMWSGQHFKLSLVAADAQSASDTTLEVCNSQGATTNVDGVVYAISDGQRYLQVGNQPMVMGWDTLVQGGGDLAVDGAVSVTGTQYGGVLVATEVVTAPSPFPYLGGLTYDGCLQLKILPVQPLPGDPYLQPSWEVHSFDGYIQGGQLELAAGTRLVAEDNGCPGIITDGPGGLDIKLDYYYEIVLNYQPKEGSFVNGLKIAYALRGDSPALHLPDMDPDTSGTLIVTQYKNTCVDKGVRFPKYNGQFNQIGTRIFWEDCSGKQAVDPTASYPLRVRDMLDYCEANYSDVVFDIEDEQPGDWRQIYVQSVTVNPSLVPGPVSFTAVADPIVNGQPVHQGAIGPIQSFAIYNPWGHRHFSRGTDNASGLDWPHITGTRNGQPFRYPCSVPRLVTDSISFCGGNPQSFYRLPFPQAYLTQVNQGNGDPNRSGPGSHDSWQEFALDLSGQLGTPLRAARGGRIVRVRDNFGINCKIEVDGKWVESGACQPLSLPALESYGNYVAIQHQDGTIAWYAHLLDGSLGNLYLGKKIQRGDPIGQTGNTGSSCGPHLHFHVTVADPAIWLADTVRVLYQAYSAQSQTVETCIIPADDQYYLSTNLP